MLKRTSKQLSMFSSLEDMLSHQHPLFQLSNKINWERFENAFSPLYCSNNGRPAHPIRLMCGLLILKHLRNVSEEMVVLNGARILTTNISVVDLNLCQNNPMTPSKSIFH